MAIYELANASLDSGSTKSGLLRVKQLDPDGLELSSSSLGSLASIHGKATGATLAETFSSDNENSSFRRANYQGTTLDRSVPEERQELYHDGDYDDEYFKREGVLEYEHHEYQDNQYQHDDQFPHGGQYKHQHFDQYQDDGQYQDQDQHGGQYQHQDQYQPQDQYHPEDEYDQETHQFEETYQQQEMQYGGAMYQNQAMPQPAEEDWATSSAGSGSCGSRTLETTGSRTLNTNMEAAVARPSTSIPRQQEMTPPRQMGTARSKTNLNGQSPGSHSSSPLHSVGSSGSGSSWGGNESRDLSLIDSADSRDSDILEDGSYSDTDDDTVEMPRTIADVFKMAQSLKKNVNDCNLNTTNSSSDDESYTEFEFQGETNRPQSSTESGKGKLKGKKGKESNVERLFNRVSALGEEFIASSRDSRDSRRRSRGGKTPRRRKDADPATKIMESLVSFEDVS
jgi:hypothetical protein